MAGLDIGQIGQRAGLSDKTVGTLFSLAIAAACVAGLCIAGTGDSRLVLFKLIYGFAVVYMVSVAVLLWVQVPYKTSVLRSVSRTTAILLSLAIPCLNAGKGNGSSYSHLWAVIIASSANLCCNVVKKGIDKPDKSDTTDSDPATDPTSTTEESGTGTDSREALLLNVSLCVILMLSTSQELRFWLATVPVTFVVLPVLLFAPSPVPPACATVAVLLNFMQLTIAYVHILTPELKEPILWVLTYTLVCGALILTDQHILSKQDPSKIAVPQLTRRKRMIAFHIAILVMLVGFLFILRHSWIATECMTLFLSITEAVLLVLISRLRDSKSRVVFLVPALEVVNIVGALATIFVGVLGIVRGAELSINSVFSLIVVFAAQMPLWAVLFYSTRVFVPSFKDGTVDQPVVPPQTEVEMTSQDQSGA